MTENPDEINDADRHVQQVIFNEGQDYAERNKASKIANKARADSRERIKQIGIRTDAYGLAIKHIKDLSPREQAEWLEHYILVMKTMGKRQAELFPEEALKIAKREADRKKREDDAKKKAAEESTRRGVDADTNPRSDPKNGGAGKGKTKANGVPVTKPNPADALEERKKAAGIRVVGTEPGEMKQPEGVQAESPPTAPTPPSEQDEGAAALAAGLPETTAAQVEKRSQSAIAAEKVEQAMAATDTKH